MEKIINSGTNMMKCTQNSIDKRYVRATAYVLASLTCLTLLTPMAYADNDEDKVNIKVLQNRSYDGCAYSGDVVIQVKYKLKTKALANMVLQGSEDGINFYQILSKEIESGRGSSLLKFHTESCLQDIQITFE